MKNLPVKYFLKHSKRLSAGDRPTRFSNPHSKAVHPRPRAGGDFVGTPGSGKSYVSIHAPARGATCPQQHGNSNPNCFNPRPRAGGDCIIFYSVSFFLESFNPRPRAGGDTLQQIKTLHLAGFNPRPRAGGDADTE